MSLEAQQEKFLPQAGWAQQGHTLSRYKSANAHWQQKFMLVQCLCLHLQWLFFQAALLLSSSSTEEEVKFMVLINCYVKQELILVSNISQNFLCFLLSC